MYEISADEKIRAEYEYRQKVWRDAEAVFGYKLDKAILNSDYEIARNFKSFGTPIEQIAQATGSSPEIISKL